MIRLFFVIAIILIAHSCSASEVKHQYERNKFQQHNACPSNKHTSGPCPGFVITNFVPLKCGGKDVMENMIWSTPEQVKLESSKPCKKK